MRYIVYLVVFLVGFVGVSLLSFFLLTRPIPITFSQTPEKVGLPEPESVTLTTSDDIQISGWHFASDESPDRVLVLLHGYPANKKDLLDFAHKLYPEFSLMLIDFRSFGESGGTLTTFGIHEQKDVRAAITFLTERGYEHIGVFGYSLGGAVAIESTAQDERIDAVASYAAFADLRTLGHDSYRHLFIFKYPLVELLNLWARIFFGEWAHTVSPERVIGTIDTPIYLGHATDDDLIPFEHAQRLADAAADNPHLTASFSSDTFHAGLPFSLPIELIDFFGRAFERSPNE